LAVWVRLVADTGNSTLSKKKLPPGVVGELRTRRAVEVEIRVAFRGIALGRGISLRQARFADRFEDAAWNAHSDSLGQGEIKDDWSKVPMDELESDCIAHLDALGFRYYIPALMLSVLDHYESSSMRVIGTLSGLYPKKDSSWKYSMSRYSLLNAAQKIAIARFLAALPELVELGFQDQKIVPRALRNYWGEFLQPNVRE
jgi:hypothetical protein